jgi:NAD(P)H-dependent FMN reductase
MKITVVSGSHRPGSMSRKVCDWIATRLKSNWGDDATVVDLAEKALPMWNEGVWGETPEWEAAFGPIATQLNGSDALVTVSPEWSGMAPPAIKNFFLLCTNEMVGHKPSLLVGVSASRGGAYPIAELRMSSYKNNHVCHIPEHVIVRTCEEVLVEDEPINKNDTYIRERLDYALGILRAYGDALGQIRASGLVDHERYPFGM